MSHATRPLMQLNVQIKGPSSWNNLNSPSFFYDCQVKFDVSIHVKQTCSLARMSPQNHEVAQQPKKHGFNPSQGGSNSQGEKTQIGGGKLRRTNAPWRRCSRWCDWTAAWSTRSASSTRLLTTNTNKVSSPIDPRPQKEGGEMVFFFPNQEEKNKPGGKGGIQGKRSSRGSTRRSSPAVAGAGAAIAGSKR